MRWTGDFLNHHPDPTQPENLRHLVDSVLANKADVGLAFDGDSDRLGAVDERGTILYGDQLMIIYAPRDPVAKAGRDDYWRSQVVSEHV